MGRGGNKVNGKENANDRRKKHFKGSVGKCLLLIGCLLLLTACSSKKETFSPNVTEEPKEETLKDWIAQSNGSFLKNAE